MFILGFRFLSPPKTKPFNVVRNLKSQTMIKELITDLAFDKITLNQALTRAKLIAGMIKNETFKQWLSKELSGYTFEDPLLPEYRLIFAEITLTAEFPFGRFHSFPVILGEREDKLDKLLNFHRVIEPISVIESNIEEIKEGTATIHLNGGAVHMVSKLYDDQVRSQGGVIRSGKRIIGKNQLVNIIELTKQKLIDILQELEEEFPDLETKYIMTEDNKDKAQNIITNNIYGNNNPLNVAAGENITQGNISQIITSNEVEKLKELGVEEIAIEELKKIDEENPKGSPERKGKIMSWISSVSASFVSRGLYDNIPQLVEFVGNFI